MSVFHYKPVKTQTDTAVPGEELQQQEQLHTADHHEAAAEVGRFRLRKVPRSPPRPQLEVFVRRD